MPRPWLHKRENIERLQEYLDEHKHLLGLGHVRFNVRRELPPKKDGYVLHAYIRFHGHYDVDLLVCRNYFGWPEQRARELLAHECAHVVVSPISDMVDVLAHCARSDIPNTPTSVAIAEADERVVCHLEPLLAQLLPELPWAS